MIGIKEKLASGQTVVQINVNYPSTRLVEFIAGLGVDAVFLDCEAGNLTINMVEEMARASRAAGLPSIVRTEDNQRHLIIRYLDCGIDGIIVPHINTAADAAYVVDAARYGRYHDIEDKMIMLLIESIEGVSNLDEILKVDGVDLLLVGTGDLAKELGFPGNPTHPVVVKSRNQAVRAIIAAGKPAGTFVSYETVADSLALGVRYLSVQANAFLTRGAAEFLRVIQPS